METTLVTAGIACVIAAIVGGGLKAFNIEVPGIASRSRQVLLGVFGTLLLLVALLPRLNASDSGGDEGSAQPRSDGSIVSTSRTSPSLAPGTERPGTFNIAFGNTIQPDIPAPGAGKLEDIGSRDIYRFQASAGDRISVIPLPLDGEPKCRGPNIKADVLDPGGGDLNGSGLTAWIVSPESCNVHVFDVHVPGIHELVMAGTDDVRGVGTYRFRFVNAGRETFDVDLTLGATTVSAGVPRKGAGALEEIGSQDVYRFRASPGARLTVTAETLNGDPRCRSGVNIKVDIFDPSGDDLNGSGLTQYLGGDRCNSHVTELPVAGVYEVLIQGDWNTTGVGTYSLRVTLPR